MPQTEITAHDQALIREINEKHGDIFIGRLRKVYGANFACGVRDSERLSAVLPQIDERSLNDLIYYHKGGSLEMRIAYG